MSMSIRRAALRSLPLILAAALLLASCSLPGEQQSATADSHACTAPKSEPSSAGAEQVAPEEADQIVRQLWQEWDRNARKTSHLDCSAETQVEEGPAFAASVTADQINGDLNRPSRDRSDPIQELHVYVPRLDRYPLWFAAVAQTFDVDQNTGRVTNNVIHRFMVFTRMSEEARWKEFVETDVPGGDPKVALDSEGYADGATGTPVIDPSQLPDAYLAYLQSGGTEHATLFAPGEKTDKMAKGTASSSTLKNTFEPYGERMFVLPMQDRSRMVVFTGGWNVRISAEQGKCYTQDSKRTKEPVYFPPGSWRNVDIDTVMVRVAFVPNRTGQVQLDGDDALVLSRGSNAC